MAGGISNVLYVQAASNGVFYVTFEEHEDGRRRVSIATHAVTNDMLTTWIVPSTVYKEPGAGDDGWVNLPQPVPGDDVVSSGPGWAVYYAGGS
jgi:hypothetical protein